MAFGNTGQPSFGAQSSNPATMLAQADQLRQQGRFAEAESLVRGVVQAQPESPSALNMLGLLLRQRGALDEAESLMRRAIKAAPREPGLHSNLGNILLARDDLEGAESAYRKAISLKSDHPDAVYNLGVALRRLDRPEEALAALRRALVLRPGYAPALVQLGTLLGDMGELEEARQTLENAVKADPKSYDARYYLGTTLNRLDRFDEAIAVLRGAVDLAFDRHEARFAMANAFAQTGRENEALHAYQTAFEKKPDFLPALYEFTALAWSTGNGTRSLQSYAYARSRLGDTPDLLLAEASLRMRLDGAAAAETLLRKAYEQAPERGDIINALAASLAMQKRFDASFPLFLEALKADPKNVRTHLDYGENLLRQGEFKEARRVLNDALALEPHNQIALAYLTLAARELGDSAYDTLVDPRFVREYEIAPPAGFNDLARFNRALAEELERLHTRQVAPIDQTLRGGTQTPGALFRQRSPAVEAVREQIRAAVADYIAGLPDGASHPMLARKDKNFSFAGSWSCRLHAAGYHTNHVHDQGWISSAYYVALPDEIGQHEQGALKFGESKFALGDRDRPARIVTPSVGKLVLFPSYFWHGTVPFQSDKARLTVAFDVTPGSKAVKTGY